MDSLAQMRIAAADITPQLRACNPDAGNMMCQSAGSKTQTPSGRLLWAAHDHAARVCLWWSDDGGETSQYSGCQYGTVPEEAQSVRAATELKILMNIDFFKTDLVF